jgi:choline dehydrogenase-like flavoprotein
MALTAETERNEPITRDDIESKLRQLRGDVDEIGKASKGYVLAAGAVLAVGVVAAAYLLGRRKGKRRATVVEIRRV